MRSLRLLLLLVPGLLALPAVAAAADVVGPERCKECHEKAFEAWKGRPHARAEEALGAKAKEPACLTCHAPQKKLGVAGVSCEACHGAGEHYSPSYVMRDPELARAVGLQVPGEKECRGCHDATTPSLSPFSFEQKLPLIDHWTADRKARTASAEAAAGAPPPPAAAKARPKNEGTAPPPPGKPASTGAPSPTRTPPGTR